MVATVGVGQAIVASWQMRNKRREIEMTAAAQFQQVYGEFKDIWRLWKVLRRRDQRGLTTPEHAASGDFPTSVVAARQLEAISKIRRKHWKAAVGRYPAYDAQDIDDIELDARPA